ncbi:MULTISPECIES: cytochrome o ubiquinol oxidase subunit IV [Larsenimonas]|uniref:Cytochrome bo(3) ubiquinol oxidase subunit 4 n=1 Tax=Larsenimonas suaedae TaxID=1851019 RepID=A0ABU1GYW0_9GAMM|nr:MULTISPECIES: cytochrome o ubiquinol oxidase subunit IV [Larsenimonas]MCM2973621.1 cytochrome o ubiquinol oxidase subunit IV [Larsenimonas suaedae]MCM5705443.1 cytochrome o ubiquinol oxidase subunit IV [Larsenimonas salina]MDR5897245.1 cytochrome o ubiquinol oxidase subunit IV [Larsenimonas suaedae]
MAHNEHTSHGGASHGTVKSYIVGFVLSVILTVIPFWMVMSGSFSKSVTAISIFVLAFIQLFVHLVYFLHMNRSSEQQWNVMAFVYTVIMVAILVIGSLWIMLNLNYNMMMG